MKSTTLFSSLASVVALATATANDVMTIENFENGSTKMEWRAINDTVMGGVSEGGPAVSKDETMVFSGSISFENQGGFSSIRTSGASLDLGEFAGVELRVKGDGRKYYLTVRNPDNRRLAYWSPVQPEAGKWVTLRVPFSSFYPTFFGQKVDGKTLDITKVNSIGFMIYDKKDGPFTIEFDWIKAYKEQQSFLY
ncbi:CIA30 family protein [Rubritalea marina]|uniref:CIA30 family protein n=1 Tax=Rubritalea marina TaxID=361055 RepID=UPI0009FC2EF7|nr:CIA30 family protein [Rubritalea marina]